MTQKTPRRETRMVGKLGSVGSRPNGDSPPSKNPRGGLLDPVAKADHVGDEDVVTHELDAFAELAGQRPPALPIVFGEPIFDRDDRVAIDPGGPPIDQFLRQEAASLAGQLVTAVAVELR